MEPFHSCCITGITFGSLNHEEGQYSTSWPHLAKTPLAGRDLSEGPGTSPSCWGWKKDIKGLKSPGAAGSRDAICAAWPRKQTRASHRDGSGPAWALLTPARPLQHGEKQLWMWSSRGTSCHQRQEGEQQGGEGRREQLQRGESSQMLLNCSFQEMSPSKSLLIHHCIGYFSWKGPPRPGRKMLSNQSIHLTFPFPDLSWLGGRERPSSTDCNCSLHSHLSQQL